MFAVMFQVTGEEDAQDVLINVPQSYPKGIPSGGNNFFFQVPIRSILVNAWMNLAK